LDLWHLMCRKKSRQNASRDLRKRKPSKATLSNPSLDE
jgi:hypothetical protein